MKEGEINGKYRKHLLKFGFPMRLEDKLSLGFPDLLYATRGLFVGIENKSGKRMKIEVRDKQVKFAKRIIGKGVPASQYWIWVAWDVYEGVHVYTWKDVLASPNVFREKSDYWVFDLSKTEATFKIYGPDSLHDWLYIHVWKPVGLEKYDHVLHDFMGGGKIEI